MRRSLLCGALGVLFVSGCMVFGTQQKDRRVDAESLSRIEKGMTKAEVTAILGAPNEIIFSNKEHDPLREHAYLFEHSTTKYTGLVFLFINLGNADEKWDRAMVFFDEEGRVSHVGATLTAATASHGLPFGS